MDNGGEREREREHTQPTRQEFVRRRLIYVGQREVGDPVDPPRPLCQNRQHVTAAKSSTDKSN